MDLNDLRFFALVVQHGGFSAAQREAGITKSKLSRRVAWLEDRLGVRLLQRSTRHLAPTEAGRIFYEHCAAMLVEADAARAAIEHLRSEPVGRVRMTCPVTLAQYYAASLVGEFMALHPKVTIELDATDRLVNLLDERIDVALRTLDAGLADPALVARKIASGRLVMVAAPGYLSTHPSPSAPGDLGGHHTVGTLRGGEVQHWDLVAADGRTARVTHRPRLLCSDFGVQVQAALGGVGVALVPQRIARGALHAGSLVRVAKAWATPDQAIHVVFPSRRGMLPSVRALIDFLAERMPTALTTA